MGTPVVIQVDAPAAMTRTALVAVGDAFVEIERLETILSGWRQESDVSRINRAAGVHAVHVAPETFALVLKAIEIGELTDGAFDVTFAPLGALWDFRRQPPVLPSARAITRARSLVDWRRIETDDDSLTVYLPAAGMRTDSSCKPLRTPPSWPRAAEPRHVRAMRARFE